KWNRLNTRSWNATVRFQSSLHKARAAAFSTQSSRIYRRHLSAERPIRPSVPSSQKPARFWLYQRKTWIMDSTHQQAGGRTNAIPPIGGTNVINVGKLERLASLGMGTGLLCVALRSRSFLKYAAILGAGGYLLYRGVSGNCPLSSSLGVGSRQGSRPHGKTASLIEIKNTLQVKRPKAEVYEFWRKLENLPRVMSHLENVETISDTRSRWTAKFPGA